ncbi:hypothetical protein GCM10008023_31010 [Sphingomonas glacialis]|uniref:Glycosyltransferase RgtA/B/C/D-like domain-containing protein n=1 Tax=Sphingomonas glacialis TaxID=658225 RepID=A0ABQ3LNS4_9SPHN|nr:hypothetical protein [Sphingomonas glacialis]GHH21827.1 hypothetical protein GCM10008023_31010 [Sphingomonas glacialis]
MPNETSSDLQWWQTRWFVAVMALIAIIPLLRPEIPPLVDLPGHMGRYRVQLSRDEYPWLSDWYNFNWQLIGNLGIDILIIPLAKLFGLELAVKLLVMTIPVLTVTGLLWIAREVHGRIPPTAVFALPLAYSYAFQFGFVNFAFSMALALNAFALWLRLARHQRFGLRAAIFVPLSCIIWVAHTFGWGVLGVLAYSAEMVRQHDARVDRGPLSWIKAWLRAGVGCVPLALPMVLMVVWRSGEHVGGQTGDWFNWRAKIGYMTMALRDRWITFDLAGMAILLLILFRGFRDPSVEYSRNLGLSALFLLAVFILLPRIVFGSAYADMRLAPFMLAIAVIAVRPKKGLSIRGSATIAALGLAFVLVRIAAGTASFWMFAQDYDRELKALDHLPVGAKLVTFVGAQCGAPWKMTRLEHLPAIALERRAAYANDQWSMAGAQLLTVKYVRAQRFAHDPSEIVTSVQCPREWWRPISKAMARFPRNAFDYVWLIRPPAYDAKFNQGLIPIWRDGSSVLFRVDHSQRGIEISDAALKTARPRPTPF